MTHKVTRRQFFQVTAAGTAAAAVPSQADAATRIQKRRGRHGEQPADLIPSLCEQCFWKCGIRGKVVDGKLERIEGNPDHPLAQGRLCARGNAGVDLLYDPDRLKYPMERVGPRGSGRFQRISWKKAYQRIASEFQRLIDQHGPDAIGFFGHGTSAKYPKLAMKGLASHSVSSASFFQCRGPREAGYTLTFGMTPGSPERLDMDDAKLIVLIGSHLGENIHVSQVSQFANGLAKGAKLAVVDPRYSIAASKSDWWLPIRPGTDTALLLTWINYVIQNNLFDADYVARYGKGFEQLAESVSGYSLAWGQAQTGLPADYIAEIGEEMGRARPSVVIHPGRQTTWYGNDTQRARSMAILTGLLGAWGREGGNFFPSVIRMGKCPCDPADDPNKELCPTDVYPFRDEHEGIPAHCIIDNSIQEIPSVRAWWIWGQNMLQSVPYPQRILEAFRKLEFVLVVDIMPTEITQFADILLPESTYLERFDGLIGVRNAKQPFIGIRQPLVKPVHNTKDGFSIVKGIMSAMGRKDCLPCPTIEEYMQRQLKPTGLSLEEVKRKGIIPTKARPFPSRPKFWTPSRKIEFYSDQLKKMGHPPVPNYTPPEKNPEGMLRLTFGRTPYHTFARTQNNRILHEHAPENPIIINDELGRSMGLKDGDRVQLENQDQVRSKPATVQLSPGIRPDVVYTFHGYGSHSPKLTVAYGQGFSDNFLLTRFAVDPETGSSANRVNFVSVVKNGKLLKAPHMDPVGLALRRVRDVAATPIVKKKATANKPAAQPAAGGGDEADGPPPGGC